jgi:hypothetical protein
MAASVSANASGNVGVQPQWAQRRLSRRARFGGREAGRATRGSGESYTDDRCLKEARQSLWFSGRSRSATVASSEASTER